MKKPFAYITAVWKGGEFTVIDQAAVYCRKVYEAGFTPICPVLYLPHFLRDSIPAEQKARCRLAAVVDDIRDLGVQTALRKGKEMCIRDRFSITQFSIFYLSIIRGRFLEVLTSRLRNFRLPFFGSKDFRIPNKVLNIDFCRLSLALLFALDQARLCLLYTSRCV